MSNETQHLGATKWSLASTRGELVASSRTRHIKRIHIGAYENARGKRAWASGLDLPAGVLLLCLFYDFVSVKQNVRYEMGMGLR